MPLITHFPHLDAAAETVIAFVRSDDAQICRRTFVACMNLLYRPDHFEYLRLTRSDVVISILQLLSSPRGISLGEQFEQRVVGCSPERCESLDNSPLGKAIHETTESPDTEALSADKMLSRLGEFVGGCFWNGSATAPTVVTLDKTRKMAKKAEKRGASIPWPAKTTDVFVNPPLIMLDSLWTLWDRFRAAGVLQLIYQLLSIAGSTFRFPVYSKLPEFPAQLVAHINRLVPICRSEKEDYVPSYLLYQLVIILDTLIDTFNDHSTPTMLYWARHAHALLLSFSQILDLLSSVRLPPCKAFQQTRLVDKLVFMGTTFFAHYNNNMYPEFFSNTSQYHPKIRDEWRRRKANMTDEKGELCVPQESFEPCRLICRVYERIAYMARQDGCARIGCPETSSTQNRRFPACGGCGILCYCSKQCQMAAWKHPHAPHKEMCKPLGTFSRKVPINWRKAQPAIDTSEAEQMVKCFGVSGDEADELLGHFRVLRMAEGTGLDNLSVGLLTSLGREAKHWKDIVSLSEQLDSLGL